jgi:hypothetical protein
VLVATFREPDEVDRGDVRSEQGRTDYGPSQVAPGEEVGIACLFVRFPHDPQADEQNAQQVGDDDDQVNHRDVHVTTPSAW